VDGEVICGVHAVAEALAADEKLKKIHVGNRRKDDPVIREITAAARAKNIAVTYEDDAFFRRFGPARHQHVAAIAPPYRYAAWHEVRAAVRENADALVVALDHIEDPQNLGAVMRNAEGAGATAVIIPDRRSAAVTPAARRSAAGAASHIRVSAVPNLAAALKDLKADGCWVYGLATSPDASPYATVDYRGRCAFVVGAEQKGLSRLMLERCDRLVRIPLLGKVSSLNASSAVAIALFEALRQRAYGMIVTSTDKPQNLVNP
jgi:23S rRNA (guanosine2251-2'-O)-methyltransferase